MEKKEVAIRLTGVKKMYKLGQIGGGSLQADLQSWWARVRGKEDPNTKIGTDQRLVGQTFMALNGIDLTVYKGEAVGIIGRNGAGKSTMLKLLSRVTAPTEGKIQLYGRVAAMLEVGTGFNGEMTGRENIYMNGAILGMTKAEIDAKMEDIIEFSEVREFIDTPVKRYSSGMYVKLAFSVAAHLDSEIMIMDEVLAVGDMKFQEKCLGRMGDAANQEGRTVLYVSHNMNTIRQFCTRCIVLDQGRIIYDGDVDKAIEIYMESAISSTGNTYDLSNKRQKYLSPIIDAKIVRLSLLDRESPSYEYAETLKFKLDISVKKLISNCGLRFEIRAADDSAVGAALFDDFPKTIYPGEFSVNLGFDLTGLVPGKYYVVLGFYQKNSAGTFSDFDVVENAFGFEIMDTHNLLGIEWYTNHWGKYKLNSLFLINKPTT